LDKNKNSKDVYSEDALLWIKTVLNLDAIDQKHVYTSQEMPTCYF
jgi:hypothetical protein